MASFTEQKKNLKIHMEAQETVDIKPSMSKKKKSESIIILDFNLYYRVIVTKTAWSCTKMGT